MQQESLQGQLTTMKHASAVDFSSQ